MKSQLFQRFENEEVTPALVKDAAELFSAHYGVWSGDGNSCSRARKGQHIIFTPKRLREQLLPSGADCALARVTVDGVLAGHAFAYYWTTNMENVGWVTQLVVHRKYREGGLATSLLRMLRRDDVKAWGILSSHPAACMAVASAIAYSIDRVDLQYIHRHAAKIMKASPIAYIRDSHTHGALFGEPATRSNISSATTDFFVDHSEPEAALKRLELAPKGRWPLGGLDDGWEYLLIVKAKERGATTMPITSSQSLASLMGDLPKKPESE